MFPKKIYNEKDSLLTKRDLINDFKNIGIKKGMTLLVHSSLRNIGVVCGGPSVVIEALIETVTYNGNIIMPTHSGDNSNPEEWENPPVPNNWIKIIKENMPPYIPEITPTRGMGAIVECFRNYPGVVRSNHPVLSFAAWGKDKYLIIDNHKLDCSLGIESPLQKVYHLGGYVLLLGVDYINNTSFHLSEYLSKTRDIIDYECSLLESGKRIWKKFQDIELLSDEFGNIGKDFEKENEVYNGKIGNANSKLFLQRDCVDFATKWLINNKNKKSKNLRIEDFIDNYSKAYPFSGNVLISKNNTIIFNNSYGNSDIENDLENTSKTKFKIASLTKIFTSLAILKLKEKRKIDLNDKIYDFFNFEIDKKISINDLLNHTSGLKNYSDFIDDDLLTLRLSENDLLSSVLGEKLNFLPGENFEYSNTNYYLLGKIIEKITDLTYEEFVKKYILNPLNLKDTGFFHSENILNFISKGYSFDGNKIINSKNINPENFYAAGGMYSTTNDLYNLYLSLTNYKIINKNTFDLILKPPDLYDKNSKKFYNLGFMVEKIDDEIKLSHNGDLCGFQSQFEFYLKNKIFILILSNYGFLNLWNITNNLYKILAKDSYLDFKKKKRNKNIINSYEEYQGKYISKNNKYFMIFKSEKNNDIYRYYIKLNNYYYTEIYPIKNYVFQNSLIDETYYLYFENNTYYINDFKKINSHF